MNLNRAEVNESTQEHNNKIPTPEQFMQQYTLAELAEIEHNVQVAMKQITEQETEKNKQHMQEIKEEKRKNQEEQQKNLENLTQKLNDETPPKEKAESLSQDEIEHIVAMIRLVDGNFEGTMQDECHQLQYDLEETSKGLTTGEITKKEFGQKVIDGLKRIFEEQREKSKHTHINDSDKLDSLMKGIEEFLTKFDIATDDNYNFLGALERKKQFVLKYNQMS